MTDNEIVLDETDNIDIKNIITKGVKDFNLDYIGVWESKPFAFYTKDDKEKIIAGAYGRYISHQLLEIDLLWVDEKYRSNKFGTQIIEAVEDFARKHQVININLYTMEYQAKAFYEKKGYKIIAVVPKWAKQYDAYFMRKVL